MITTEQLSILLNAERSEYDRLESLYKLEAYLDQEDIITALASLAKTEQNAVIRTALLKIVVNSEITNLENKEQYLKILFYFSSIEREEELRLIAIERLNELAFQDDRIELLLAENLLYDTSQRIQENCLLGLQKTNCKYDTTITTLSLYAEKITQANIETFIKLLAKLPAAKSEAILVTLLHPINNETIKHYAIIALSEHPSLQPSTLEYILEALLDDNQSSEFEESVALLLSTRVLQDLSIIDAIIKNLNTNPYSKTKLLPLLNLLIATGSTVVEKIKTLYRGTDSTYLKVTILALLHAADALDIATESLTDSNLHIRYQALNYCSANLEKDTNGIIQAILHALEQESNNHLRNQLAKNIKKVNYLDKESEKILLNCCDKEENPWVLETLTEALFLVNLHDDNQEILLKIYLKILNGAFFTDRVKDYIIGQLSDFAYTDTPELSQCLAAFMLREFSITRIEKLYNQYSKLKLADNEHIVLVLQLFERFIHYYPHNLLHTWASELKQKISSNEKVGEKAAFLAKITGDNHFLLNQGALNITSPFIENIVESIRAGQSNIAKQILLDAYRNRTIKKQEIVQLLKILLISFDNSEIIYKLLEILREQRLITTEIVATALDFINDYPDIHLSSLLEQMLESMGKNLPEYAQCLEQKMTSEHFLNYKMRTSQVRANYSIEWRSSWKDIYSEWPMGKLWSQLYPNISFLKFYNQSEQKQKNSQSLDYYILRKLSKTRLRKEEVVGAQTISGEEVLLSIGNIISQLEPDNIPGSLYDRTLNVFSTKWKEFITLKEQPSEELSQCAAKIHYALFKRWNNYPERTPSELSILPLWLDLNLFNTLLNEDNMSFNDFFNPYDELIKIEIKQKIQNITVHKQHSPNYRAVPTFEFLPLHNYITTVTDFIITAKWTTEESQTLKESLILIDKVWKGAIMDRLQIITENKRNEVLQELL